jgi:hypothetical protein
VDAAGRLQGVVSLFDLLRFILVDNSKASVVGGCSSVCR